LTSYYKNHIIVSLIPPLMFIRRPESGAPSRTSAADQRILEYIKIYEANDKPDLVEKCREAIVFNVLERNRENGFLLEATELQMLQYDEIIPLNVIGRLKRILGAKS